MAPRAASLPHRAELRQLRLTPDQGRAARLSADGGTAIGPARLRALARDPPGERGGLGIGGPTHLRREPRRERGKRGLRCGTVTGQRERAHGGPHGDVRRRVERERAPRQPHRVRGAAPTQLGLRLPRQRVHGARAPQRPLRREPVLELGRPGHRKALEELPADEPGGARPVLRAGERVEAVGVELHGVGGETDARGVGLEARVAGAAAQNAQRFVERVPRGAFGLVGPEEPDQVVAGPRAFGRPRQVDEERHVLAPQQLPRRRPTVDAHVHGTERAAADHRPQPPASRRRASTTSGR